MEEAAGGEGGAEEGGKILFPNPPRLTRSPVLGSSRKYHNKKTRKSNKPSSSRKSRKV
jgi:hypothetical protein